MAPVPVRNRRRLIDPGIAAIKHERIGRAVEGWVAKVTARYAHGVSDGVSESVSESATVSSADVSFEVNGEVVVVDEHRLGGRGPSLLEVLREQLGLMSVKDGCSPQGQCGCCTVLVDGQARVACVTPARRVRGRAITTLEGLDGDRSELWADAFCQSGASQCGFCTPGIIMRLDAASQAAGPDADVNQALLAHLCRCTGWQTIHEAWDLFQQSQAEGTLVALAGRDFDAARRRAALEGGVEQDVGSHVAKGSGGFAADTAPEGALIAVRGDDGGWVVCETLAEARDRAGKVQGRRTTAAAQWPLDVPDGDWRVTLRTNWVDPAYLETDASWCEPGGEPADPVANGGAFGAKVPTEGLELPDVARRLADEHQRPVLVLASREDVARFGPKRPPMAAGVSADGEIRVRVADTPGIVEAIEAGLALNSADDCDLTIETVSIPGPPTSASIRAAGWAEAAMLAAGAAGKAGTVRSPQGAEASAEVDLDANTIRLAVSCGPILDEVVLRSYCIGAAHMAWSWLTSESVAVDAEGVVHDLTVRSFGVVRAVDTPHIEVELRPGDGEPVNGSDAVFAAVAASGWLALGCPQDLPATGVKIGS